MQDRTAITSHPETGELLADAPAGVEGETQPELSDGHDELESLPVVPEQFNVCDADTASWLLRKVNESRAYIDRVKDWADREIRRAKRDEEFLLMRYGPQLETWASGEIERLRGRRRSISLPGGTCGYRRVKTVLVVDDEQAVMKWAHENLPAAIQTVERLMKSAINQYFEASGEVPPEGVRVAPSHDAFYVK